MNYLGSDFNSTGSVIAKSELTAARLKRGECVTCGRKCFKKKFLKMVPIDDEEGNILNGRCLNCKPLSMKHLPKKQQGSGHGSSHSRSTRNNRSHHGGSQGSLRRSKSVAIDATVAVAECKPASHKHLGSVPPKRTLSSPARSQNSSYHRSAVGTNNGIGATSRSRGSSSNDSSFGGSNNVHTIPSNSGHSLSGTSSLASICSAASGSTATTVYRQPLSRQDSIDSCGSMNSNSNSNRSLSKTTKSSREELEQAAQTLMAAAKEHGLADGTLVASLSDIVNLGNGVSAAGGQGPSDKLASKSFDSSEEEPPSHPSPDVVVSTGGVLNRGGAFPMRYGRHIYTGSTRTLSSMSSIDEGDQQQLQQQSLRMVGKSCRTLGSLSTIDGTDEEEIQTLNDDIHSNLSGPSGTPASDEVHNEEKKEGESATDDDKTTPETATRCLERLKESTLAPCPAKSIEAIECLLEFVACLFDPASELDLLIETGGIQALVSAMGKYSKSPGIQARACELLSVFASPCGSSNTDDDESRKRRRTVLDQTNGAGEAILYFSMILHEDSAEVQQAALNAIHCLCEDCGENQADFLKLDVMEPILRAMEHHRNEARLQEIGSSLISLLASNPDNENVGSAIGLNGGVPVILRAILVHLDNARVAETCSRALYELTLGDPHNVVVVLKTPGAICAILDAMRSHPQNTGVQEMGCAVLSNLTADAEYVPLLITNGQATEDESEEKSTDVLGLVLETILEAIQGHSGAPTVQDLGCAALANLTDSDETKMFVVDKGVLDAIVLAMVLHADHAEVQERVCRLLLLLAVKVNHKQIQAAIPIEIVRAAAKKFPDRCSEPANRLVRELGL
ncbi:unnamed protein product [Pseudo-nitzschia multistriata]|uniref:LRRK2 ARM repeat domain-containing protein n=1 Tax=Pseudo-nitzschia multistriata TaxID=183589 RepID=A0A448ZMG4_9STRA|nr:unnamed protein product [Pseudo-nitzschia multistriata]